MYNPNTQNQTLPELININTVMALTTFSRTKIYKMMNEGEFPRNSKIGRGSYWKRRVIEEWINNLAPATDEQIKEAAEEAARMVKSNRH